MTTIELLEQDEPEVAASLREMTASCLQLVAVAVAEHALDVVRLDHFVPLVRADLPGLRDARDDAAEEYWRLHGGDEGPGLHPGADEAFARERALSAACAAFGDDPLGSAAEAFYEASFAVGDLTGLRTIVRRGLELR